MFLLSLIIKQTFDNFFVSSNASIHKWSPSKNVFTIQINAFA